MLHADSKSASSSHVHRALRAWDDRRLRKVCEQREARVVQLSPVKTGLLRAAEGMQGTEKMKGSCPGAPTLTSRPLGTSISTGWL
jgi:hypothetical protein